MLKTTLRIVLPVIVALSTAFVATAQSREAAVTGVEIIADANGVSVLVSGSLPNGCTELGAPEQTVERNTIRIRLPLVRQSGVVCTQAIVLFEETIPVDVSDLTPGDYTIDVNGISDTFTLTQEMIDAPLITPEPTEEAETTQPVPSTAFIERVEIRFNDDDAVNALVAGNLPDGCTELVGYTQSITERQIALTLLTTRPLDVACTDALVPFEATFPVDVSTLSEGTYSVMVNEVASPPFILSSESQETDDDCVLDSDESKLFRNIRDGYCVRFPASYMTQAPEPGSVAITAVEQPTVPVLTITSAAAEGQTLDNLASESEQELEEAEIGGEAALVSSEASETGAMQGYVVRDAMLYTFTLTPTAESAESALTLWETVLTSFIFLEA